MALNPFSFKFSFKSATYSNARIASKLQYNLASHINPLTTRKVMHVRCARYYELFEKNGSSLPRSIEILFHDGKVMFITNLMINNLDILIFFIHVHIIFLVVFRWVQAFLHRSRSVLSKKFLCMCSTICTKHVQIVLWWSWMQTQSLRHTRSITS